MSRQTEVETAVLDLLELRKTCVQTLPEEVSKRIHVIRDLCKAAEAIDGNGQVSWRKGAASGGGGHGGGHYGKRGGGGGGWRGPPSSSRSGPPNSGSGGHDKPYARYVSKFKNTETPVENTILNVLIMNKLNNFADKNYEDVKKFLEQVLDGDEKDFLKDFMRLVFTKASTEPTFCPLYARLLSELSRKYGVLLTELNLLYTDYMGIFDEVAEEQCSSYEQFVQRNREKQCRMGYSQFLAELTSAGILELEQLKMLYGKILDQITSQAVLGETKTQQVEQLGDCLLMMTRAFQKGSAPKLLEIRLALRQMFEPKMEAILSQRRTTYPGLSKKGSFAIMDCLDIFRENTTRA